jgi:predicted transcriptional regulator
MPENYFVSVRKIEKQKLLNFIKQNPNVSIKKLLALFSLQTGLKTSTLQTYINELRDAELIE